MVDVYGAHQTRLYYVTEDDYGTTPANPAMKEATKKTMAKSLSRFIPRPIAISLLSIPARTMAPIRVLS